MARAWTSSWIWSLPIIAMTLMFHSAMVVSLAILLARLMRHIERKCWPLRSIVLSCVVAVGAVGWLLGILHGPEAGIWAAVFVWLDALASPGDAMLYSLDSLTSRGASGLVLEPHWRLLGALEAANGVLLFGISTAFLFTVIAGVTSLVTRTAHERRHGVV